LLFVGMVLSRVKQQFRHLVGTARRTSVQVEMSVARVPYIDQVFLPVVFLFIVCDIVHGEGRCRCWK
jgi:hypothetical protein